MFSSTLDNVREYFSGDSEKTVEERHTLYNYRYIKMKYKKSIYDEDFDEWVQNNIDGNGVIKKTTRDEILDAAYVTLDAFQMWGLLQYKNFLPIWVFETASGYSIIKLYEATFDIIQEESRTNPFYAGHFKGLCERINAKYKKAIRICRECESEFVKENLGIENAMDNEIFKIIAK